MNWEKLLRFFLTRRDFLKKTSAAGIATAYVGSSLGNLVGNGGAIAQEPAADPIFDVVKVYNQNLTDNLTIQQDPVLQDAHIARDLAWSLLDNGINCLMGTQSAATAWQNLVPIPNGKTIGQVKIAVKVNYLGGKTGAHPKIIAWVLTGLVNRGILPANIYVYDNNSKLTDVTNNIKANYPQFNSVIFGSQGQSGSHTVPYNSTGGVYTTQMTTIVGNDTVDYIINMALPKSHGAAVGGFTMLFKNHYGTFPPRCSDGTYLAAINAYTKIKDKTILNLIDAIYASRCCGPSGDVSHVPRTIYLGRKTISTEYLAAYDLTSGGVMVSGTADYQINTARIEAWANIPTTAVYGITTTQLQALRLKGFKNCSQDLTPPQAPTNLKVTPVA
jgi:hypothetical protein